MGGQHTFTYLFDVAGQISVDGHTGFGLVLSRYAWHDTRSSRASWHTWMRSCQRALCSRTGSLQTQVVKNEYVFLTRVLPKIKRPTWKSEDNSNLSDHFFARFLCKTTPSHNMISKLLQRELQSQAIYITLFLCKIIDMTGLSFSIQATHVRTLCIDSESAVDLLEFVLVHQMGRHVGVVVRRRDLRRRCDGRSGRRIQLLLLLLLLKTDQNNLKPSPIATNSLMLTRTDRGEQRTKHCHASQQHSQWWIWVQTQHLVAQGDQHFHKKKKNNFPQMLSLSGKFTRSSFPTAALQI